MDFTSNFMSLEDSREQLISLFLKAVSEDEWGQIIEAQESYKKIIFRLLPIINGLDVSVSEKDYLLRLAACIETRQSTMIKSDIKLSLADMKKLSSCLRSAFTPTPLIIPVSESIYRAAYLSLSSSTSLQSDAPKPRTPTASPSGTGYIPKISRLSVEFKEITLKDIALFRRPRIEISVVDMRSNQIVDSYSIDVEVRGTVLLPLSLGTSGNEGEARCYFPNIPLETFQAGLFALFFELKHWKENSRLPGGGYWSTKCWSFMEPAEIQQSVAPSNSGETEVALLEIYKKPTDLTRKKLSLHTKKDFFMHVRVKFVEFQGYSPARNTPKRSDTFDAPMMSRSMTESQGVSERQKALYLG